MIVRWFCTSPRQFDHWSVPLLILYVPFVKMKMFHTREERESEIFNGSKNTQTHDEELGGTLSIFVWGIEKHAFERLNVQVW